jgi:arsenate reductase (glutaredoxin)
VVTYGEPVEVWFNPACSKCRNLREHLDSAGVEYTLRRYLEDPPDEAELRAALTAAGLEPWDITRMSEPLARELGLADMVRDADAWIRVLAEHPQLVQRPLVLSDDGRAWVARDDDTLTEVVAAGRRPSEGSRPR